MMPSHSTCLSVFWRNKRDGGKSCGGRERGGSQGHHTGGVPLLPDSTCKYGQIFTHTSLSQQANDFNHSRLSFNSLVRKP